MSGVAELTNGLAQSYAEKVKQFRAMPDGCSADVVARYAVEFPLAVYGTLRQGHYNYARLIEPMKPVGPLAAVLPGVYAEGIQVYPNRHKSLAEGCPFEIFRFNGVHDMNQTLDQIDRLESFSPELGGYSCYIRALAWVNVLEYPVWGVNEHFPNPPERPNINGLRSMRVTAGLTRLPCWVYAGMDVAELLRETGVFIWHGRFFEHAA